MRFSAYNRWRNASSAARVASRDEHGTFDTHDGMEPQVASTVAHPWYGMTWHA